ncbi:osmoprotectant transport system substrate-binding protein [Kushneria sinocarnis]|uniref:Osmoprotectant transport system substrate-binding protein n=1 Tax=Kushneria sinocarnis TaxID=595502 RepID=A0A420WX94_9GAMM|nr:ABC transporter substrate-binding protein [Kushneria sinocarnis]RKR04381.1 osmoprotectant transport system substrate-binding protein [Kushneria sinocarnis]
MRTGQTAGIRLLRGLGLGTLLMAVLAGCSGGDDEPQQQTQGEQGSGGGPTVTIGSTNFSEQLILANIYADVLQDRGVNVNTRLNLGSREVVFPALQNGEVDVLPEYTGAVLAYLDRQGQYSDARHSDEVGAALDKALPDTLTALEYSPAQDRDVLVVTGDTASKYNLQTIGDLAPVAGEMTLGGPPETRTRDAGMPGLKRVYDVAFGNFRSLDAGGPLTRGALANGDIDVARMFSSQGAIEQNDWVILEDDRDLVPAQNVVPIVREEALTPEIRKALNEVSARLTTEELQAMNRQVEVDKADPASVAQQWFDDHFHAEANDR